MKCPNPPPYFAPKTPQGIWTWDKKLAQTNYSAKINYSCPEGYLIFSDTCLKHSAVKDVEFEHFGVEPLEQACLLSGSYRN